LMPDPGWPNTRLMLTWVGAKGVFYPCPEADGFQPDIDAIERLVTPRTKMLLINSPNNPSGAVYPRETIERLVELGLERWRARGARHQSAMKWFDEVRSLT